MSVAGLVRTIAADGDVKAAPLEPEKEGNRTEVTADQKHAFRQVIDSCRADHRGISGISLIASANHIKCASMLLLIKSIRMVGLREACLGNFWSDFVCRDLLWV
jgi:hypothetical protein